MRRVSILVASLGVALAACDGSKGDAPPARPAVVAPTNPEPTPHAAPPVAADGEPAPPATKTAVVRVRLSAESPFQGPLYASLHRIDDPNVDRRRPAGGVPNAREPFSSDRVATLTVPRPGRYQVQLDVETLESNIAKPGVLGSGAFTKQPKRMSTIPADPVVTVGDDGAPVEVVVAIVVTDAR